MPVNRADVLAADLSHPFRPMIPDIAPEQPLLLNWVTTPPSPGSGGHTTLFRIIRHLETNGYRIRVYFYDVYRGDHQYYKSVVREYYGFAGPVASVNNGMADAHAVVATGWPTAYPVFNSRCAGKRFYFVQDFEPHFYPVGSLSSLAESTYRMGFVGITVGQCFAQKLRTEYGMEVEPIEYGCDLSRYHILNNLKRSGVVFYARRETARRGFELGLMALEVLAKRRPDVEIHIYGDKMGTLPFAFFDHGRVPPSALNEIYNRCFAGLNLSFTNVSLVAMEMLAAGCIPVVNDSPLIRMDLKNPLVRYAQPFPQALASELEALLITDDPQSLSRTAATSVRALSWENVGASVDTIIRRTLQRSVI